jgi:pre-mRNA-splicing helicase BRR2
MFYLSLMNEKLKIESQLIPKLADCINAEVCLGNISSLEDAVQWIKQTYLYVRMRKSPEVYGISQEGYFFV